jgi:hypothetical protein
MTPRLVARDERDLQPTVPPSGGRVHQHPQGDEPGLPRHPQAHSAGDDQNSQGGKEVSPHRQESSSITSSGD